MQRYNTNAYENFTKQVSKCAIIFSIRDYDSFNCTALNTHFPLTMPL